MHTLMVDAPSHRYPIYIDATLSSLLEKHLAEHITKDCVIVSNDTIAPLYLKTVQDAVRRLGIRVFDIILPDGEHYKNLNTIEKIYDGLMRERMERQSTLIALGGGVIGDMVGFAAATYQRGMPFIQIPTTLLSQVDSSVGGKTGVNHALGKNMIGAFYQPQAVFAALDVLNTLPEREFSAGLAEVIKYALLGDAAFFDWLETHMEELMRHDADALSYVVHRCCAKKAEIVAADEKEKGIRAWLNLGHTFGHAIETEMGYGVWLHGEAVAAGMVVACRLSEQLGYITPQETQRVQQLLQRAELPDTPPSFAWEKWIAHMQHDKKVESGTMRFVVMRQLGQAEIYPCQDISIIQKSLQEWLP